MLTLLVSVLLTASPPQAPLAQPRPGDDCEDIRRIELSPPVTSSPLICVSPGLVTSVLFDRPVEVELQDEVHFVEVIRGRRAVAFIPPGNMLPGDSLHMTAVLQVGDIHQSLTLVLVAHPGQGSHQVEVSYTRRSWQSLSDALGLALIVNKRLNEQIAALQADALQMRAHMKPLEGLCGVYAGGQLPREGIKTRVIQLPREPENTSNIGLATAYRGRSNVAVEVLLGNQTQQPWVLEKAALVTAKGERLEALRFWQPDAREPDGELRVFVEFEPTGFEPDGSTLTLVGTGGQVVSLPNVFFP